MGAPLPLRWAYLSVVITVQAAARVAAGLGVTSDEPVVLADGANVIVYLRASPVVATDAASTAAVRCEQAGGATGGSVRARNEPTPRDPGDDLPRRWPGDVVLALPELIGRCAAR